MNKVICNDCNNKFYGDSVVCPECGSSNISFVDK